MEKKSTRLAKLIKACGILAFTGLLAFNVFTYLNSGSAKSALTFSALDARADDPESEDGQRKIFEVVSCTAYIFCGAQAPSVPVPGYKIACINTQLNTSCTPDTYCTENPGARCPN